MREAMSDDRKLFENRMTPEILLGKQQDFPAGEYGPTDEGALSFAVGHDSRNGKVVIDFGSPVHWMALDADQARHFAQLLMNHAEATRTTPLARSIKKALSVG